MKSSDSTEDLATIVHRGAPKPIRKWAIVLVVLALVIVGLLYARGKSAQEEGKPTFVTQPLKRGDLAIGIDATGNLQPTNKVSISSELSGISEAVYVDRNDQVKKGQPLVKLDTRKLDQQTAKIRATRDSAKARVSQVEATLRESSANLKRLNELHELSKGRTPSASELETAAATVDRAKADLESAVASFAGAEADLKATESDLSKAIIRSPVDGIVLTRSIEIGQTLAASFNAPELFVIAEDLRQMKLLVSVGESDSGLVKDGQNATFRVEAWPNRPYSAKVKIFSYGSAVLDNVVTYQAELEVKNDDLTLRPGMTATATIDVAKAENVLLVPAAALRFKPIEENVDASAGPPKKTFMQSITFQFPRRSGGRRPGGAEGGRKGKAAEINQQIIYTLRDGKPVEIPVKTGLTDDRMTEIITDQLKEGDPIIVRQIMPPTP